MTRVTLGWLLVWTVLGGCAMPAAEGESPAPAGEPDGAGEAQRPEGELGFAVILHRSLPALRDGVGDSCLRLAYLGLETDGRVTCEVHRLAGRLDLPAARFWHLPHEAVFTVRSEKQELEFASVRDAHERTTTVAGWFRYAGIRFVADLVITEGRGGSRRVLGTVHGGPYRIYVDDVRTSDGAARWRRELRARWVVAGTRWDLRDAVVRGHEDTRAVEASGTLYRDDVVVGSLESAHQGSGWAVFLVTPNGEVELSRY